MYGYLRLMHYKADFYSYRCHYGSDYYQMALILDAVEGGLYWNHPDQCQVPIEIFAGRIFPGFY